MACFAPINAYVSTKRGADTKKFVKMYPKKSGNMGNSKIPCSRCIGCKLDYSRDWATRCVLEAKLYGDNNYFITLTYDNDNLPLANGIDPDTGELSKLPTLKNTHLTQFMKLLRQKYKRDYNHDGIRFYGCGEYGSTTLRPHYHISIFNIFINDLTFYKRNRQGDKLYNSAYIQSIWKKGYVVIAPQNWTTAAYVARYVYKKQLVPLNNVADFQEKEFVRMSRNPGIGIPYYEKYRDDIYSNDSVIINMKGELREVPPPKAFDKKYSEHNLLHFDIIKDRRLAKIKLSEKLSYENTGLTLRENIFNQFDYKRRKTILFKTRDIDI